MQIKPAEKLYPVGFSQRLCRFAVGFLVIAVLWPGGAGMIGAQEYESDRVFIRQQGKYRCQSQARIRFEEIKRRREMTAEHEHYLNWDVTNRDKAGIRLSARQRSRLHRMLQGKTRKDLLKSRELWRKRKQEFDATLQRCKVSAAD